MTPADLSRTVLHAVRRAVAEDALRAPVPARVRVERTRPGGRGEYACAVALQLAGPAALPARDVAAILRERVLHAPGIGDVEITGPGFLNFTLSAGAHGLDALVRTVGAHGTAYGHGDALAGTKVSFVPVEELRARVVTEAVERLLRSQGATVGEHAMGGEALHVVPVPAADRDLFDRLGNDAARWALLRAAPHDRPRDTGAARSSYSRRAIRCSGCGTHTPGSAPWAVTPGSSDSERRTRRAWTRPSSPRCSPTTLECSPPPPGTGSPTGSPGSWKPSRTPSSTSTTALRRSPSVTRNPRPPTVPGSLLPKPPGRCWQAACPCSASAHPKSSDEIRESRATR